MGFQDESSSIGNKFSVYNTNIIDWRLWAFKMSLLVLAITFLCIILTLLTEDYGLSR